MNQEASIFAQVRKGVMDTNKQISKNLRETIVQKQLTQMRSPRKPKIEKMGTIEEKED